MRVWEGGTKGTVGGGERNVGPLNDEYPSTSMMVIKCPDNSDVLVVGGVDGTVRTFYANSVGTVPFTGDVEDPTAGTGMFGKETNVCQPHDLPITSIGDSRGGEERATS